MILEEQLKEITIKNDINVFEVDNEIEELKKIGLSLGDDIEKLITFTNVNNIKSIFYTYSFYNEYEYLIDEEDEEAISQEYGNDILEVIKKDILNHNKIINSFDFTRPMELYVFVIYQGRYVSISIADYWEYDLDLVSSREKIYELVSNNMNLLQEKIEKEKKEFEDLRNEFKEYILNDSKFENCTNHGLRREYMRTVFDNEDTKKYRPLFTRSGGILHDTLDIGRFLDFLEMVWKEFKSKNIKK